MGRRAVYERRHIVGGVGDKWSVEWNRLSRSERADAATMAEKMADTG